MHYLSKLTYFGASLALAAASVPLSAPSWAQEGRFYPTPYSNYRGPDGTYDSLADFIRDRNGTPCGINCTRAAQERWERYFAQHPYGR
jgi:hypothetical protein